MRLGRDSPINLNRNQITKAKNPCPATVFKYLNGALYKQYTYEYGTVDSYDYLLDEDGYEEFSDFLELEFIPGGFKYIQHDIDYCYYDSYSAEYECTGCQAETYYYLTNNQGDVIGLIDMTTGQIIVEYTYDAWGNILSITGDTVLGEINPIRYRSYYYDNETKLYFLQTRYYDPQIGRFINSDGQLNGNFLGLNMYAYCENNPVNAHDPCGTNKIRVGTIDDTKQLFQFKSSLSNLESEIRKNLVKIAEQELAKGFKEKNGDNNTPYGKWFGMNPAQWCAMFVAWCANQAGVLGDIIPKIANAGMLTGMGSWYDAQGRFEKRGNYTPKPGDIIFISYGGSAPVHVGMVAKVENGIVYTIEGNVGDTIKKKSYALTSTDIYGYGKLFSYKEYER